MNIKSRDRPARRSFRYLDAKKKCEQAEARGLFGGEGEEGEEGEEGDDEGEGEGEEGGGRKRARRRKGKGKRMARRRRRRRRRRWWWWRRRKWSKHVRRRCAVGVPPRRLPRPLSVPVRCAQRGPFCNKFPAAHFQPLVTQMTEHYSQNEPGRLSLSIC